MMEAATDQWPEVIAQIAERHHEGPLLAAAFEHHMVHVDDLYADVPWREYQRDALEQTPIRSVLSFELFQMKTGVSTLNFYADQPHAFDEESREMGLIFATHIALAWQLLRRNDEFRSALASRDIIGQAPVVHKLNLSVPRGLIRTMLLAFAAAVGIMIAFAIQFLIING